MSPCPRGGHPEHPCCKPRYKHFSSWDQYRSGCETHSANRHDQSASACHLCAQRSSKPPSHAPRPATENHHPAQPAAAASTSLPAKPASALCCIQPCPPSLPAKTPGTSACPQ